MFRASHRAPQCGEYSSGAFDVRHAFNANAIYELPFGPGKEFLNQAGAFRTLFGSWSLSSNFTARTGFPVNLTTSATGPDGNTNEQRPNLVPGQPLYLAGGDFNPAAFCTPALRTRSTRVARAPQDSAMSPAISCEVPGSGKWIWRFPKHSGHGTVTN